MRRDSDRIYLVGQHEVKDRQVVRREIPEDVDVGLDKPEIDADRVDELDLTDFPAPR